jgi:hypothetical protein
MLSKSFSLNDNLFRPTGSGHDAGAQEKGYTHEQN